MSVRSTPEDFWRRVKIGTATECWLWQGSCNSTGYGSLTYQGQCVTAHRLAYHLSKEPIPLLAPKDRKGTGFVLHGCDNPRCCNPKHLTLGTYSANQKEAYTRNRRAQPKGEAHANAKLTRKEASAIRVRYALGETQQALADEFKVSQIAVSLLIRRKTYK